MVNYENITIDYLEKEEKCSTILIQALRESKYKELYTLGTDRAKREIMEPILYAVKNTNKTFAVFKYCLGEIQKDRILASKIAQDEPEIIKGTEISKDKDFIIENLKNKPELANYMDDTLKNNMEVIEAIYDTGNEEAIKLIAQNERLIMEIMQNPTLSNDKEYMLDKVAEFGEAIQLASPELKNDYDFLKEAYQANEKAIDYTAEHTDEFGEKGLLAAKEVVLETTLDKVVVEANEKLEEYLRKIEEKKLEISMTTGKECEEKQKELKELELEKRHAQTTIRFMEKIKNATPEQQARAIELINGECKKMEPEYKKKTGQFLTLNTAMKEKQQKSLNAEDIRNVAKDFGKLQGNPKNELGELRDAIKNPEKEQEESIEEQSI